ncbi:hypothetical protein IKF27_02560 [Candidatus Saccharibacteria bacterium]|nr:hypothetical protein [Candidatus Saccharibacteria bacterium]MBR3366158.1 hypothetical protein [Candidatus Saccharibacteria bacterium]
MAQAKKKTATKTAKKQTARQTQARRQVAKRTACKRQQQQNSQEKFHVYVVTALSLIAGILLCANAAVMMVV